MRKQTIKSSKIDGRPTNKNYIYARDLSCGRIIEKKTSPIPFLSSTTRGRSAGGTSGPQKMHLPKGTPPTLTSLHSYDQNGSVS